MNIFNGFLGKLLYDEKELSMTTNVVKEGNVFRYSDNQYRYSIWCEELIKKRFNTVNCVLVTNATAALRASLVSLYLNPGEEIVIPKISFIATVNAVLSVGLLPRFVDINNRGHLCPKALEKALDTSSNNIKGIIVVHLDGSSAEMDKITKIANKYSIPIIEDVAQSFSVRNNGRHVGTFGHIGCFSFQQNKILSAGEGGAIISDDSQLFERAKSFGDHGAIRDLNGIPSWENNVEGIGYGENHKVTELTSALLYAQLNKLDEVHSILRDNYQKMIRIFPKDCYEERPEGDIFISVWIKDRDLIKYLRSKTKLYYDWKSYNLIHNPIVSKYKSPYKNRFPWNLRRDTQIEPGNNYLDVIESTIMIPVPTSFRFFSYIYHELKRIL